MVLSTTTTIQSPPCHHLPDIDLNGGSDDKGPNDDKPLLVVVVVVACLAAAVDVRARYRASALFSSKS